jgi:hypothetical protein
MLNKELYRLAGEIAAASLQAKKTFPELRTIIQENNPKLYSYPGFLEEVKRSRANMQRPISALGF